MKLVKEVFERALNFSYLDIEYRIRKAARAIVLNEVHEIALLYVTSEGYYKLPGGGIEQGEDIVEALKREVLEEVGCHIEILSELGITIEYRNQINQLQISYSYLTELKGSKLPPTYTQEELDEGFRLVWVNIDKAIRLMKNYTPTQYVGRFIVERDLALIVEAENLLIGLNREIKK